MVLEVEFPVEGKTTPLIVVFPDTFPEMRPEVYAPGLALPRHQNPIAMNLCLLDRNSAAWDPEQDIDSYLRERIPLVLEAARNPGSELEVAQGEPVTVYYDYREGAVAFIPEFALTLPNSAQHGTFQFGLQKGKNADPVRLLVSKVYGEDGSALGEVDTDLGWGFGDATFAGRWVRLPAAPIGDAGLVAEVVVGAYERYAHPKWQRFTNGHRFDVIGILFPEEVKQSKTEDSWLFLIRAPGKEYLCRSQRLTKQDFAERIPELHGLQSKSVALVGLGSLGAPSAIEFAKAMTMELRVLDDDTVEAGTSVRWPFGIATTGYSKARVIFESISSNYPFTRVKAYPQRVGRAIRRSGNGLSEQSQLSAFLEDADLIYEATGEIGIQHVFSNLGRTLEIPQVYVSATEGLYGGIVARVIPGRTGCWWCFKQHQVDKTLPVPRGNAAATVQPRGCSAPTFVGAGFDVLPLVAQGIRVAVQTIASDAGHYPLSSEDVFVLQLRDEIGDAIAPTWTAFQLTLHPNCPFCHPKP